MCKSKYRLSKVNFHHPAAIELCIFLPTIVASRFVGQVVAVAVRQDWQDWHFHIFSRLGWKLQRIHLYLSSVYLTPDWHIFSYFIILYFFFVQLNGVPLLSGIGESLLKTSDELSKVCVALSLLKKVYKKNVSQDFLHHTPAATNDRILINDSYQVFIRRAVFGVQCNTIPGFLKPIRFHQVSSSFQLVCCLLNGTTRNSQLTEQSRSNT